MFEAQILFKNNAVYSVWFPRGGDNARFTLEVIAITTGVTLKVEAFTKNREDAGDGSNADAGTFISVTATGRAVAEFMRTLKEMVRYKFTVTSTGASTDYVLFRMLTPVFFDSVAT